MRYSRKRRTRKRRRGGMKKHTRSVSNNNNDMITVHISPPSGDVIHKSFHPYYASIGMLRLDLSKNKKTHLNTIQITTDDEKQVLPDSEHLINNKLYYVRYINSNHPYTKTYAKHMSDREYEITMEMNEKGITPRVLQSFRLKNNSNDLKWSVVMESWPMTWFKYKKTDKYHSTRDILLPRLLEKIEIAHRSGIFHGDLTTHADNVMVDLERLDVAIIDWGQSYYIDKITDSDIKMMAMTEEIDSNIRTPDELLRYEYNYVKDNY
jgi:tRNA A-37 threonylcarbamoyl transferase component Bud32